jgi:glycosyltransferase involved in cell wall biosynthesis
MRAVARLARDRTSATHLYSRLGRIATRILATPQNSTSILRLYRLMEEVEAQILRKHINERKDVLAWYCPAAFWPHFNLIDAPRVACVPDVVLSEFPIGFSIFGDRILEVFKSVAATIKGGDHFVTYSETTKRRTLVERYHVCPSRITVVPHGANRLDKAVFVTGFPDNESATDALCQSLMQRALHKAVDGANAAHFDPRDTKFIFYASQIRPNKNVISLLRAYEFLLKRRYVGHKLVLTGKPNVLPEVAKFVREHNLQGDVLFLHGLSDQELAACYRLADLAVNPSLSEGGCPFTLTEALSVGTPVVMARIAVTEEVVTATELRELMLFDPYDWEDVAKRIEWALDNREMLLERQMVLYENLAKRTWRDVVGEHIAILDRISGASASGGTNSSDRQRDGQDLDGKHRDGKDRDGQDRDSHDSEIMPRRQHATGGS